ncbi:MAG: hypothetical protein CR988_06840 [Treponema sp.]|nr:MAG: hypothetical protein CR988_06840 [Treponema sp.]
MNILNIMLFFGFVSPIVLFSGIGTDRLFLNSHSTRVDLKYYFILIPFTVTMAVLLWTVNKYIILPLKIQFLAPVLFITILVSTTEIMEHLFKIRYKSPAEKNYSYGIIFFAVYSSISLITVITIVISGFLSLLLFSLIISHIKSKIDMGNASLSWRIAPLILISIGFLTLATYSSEVSWLQNIFF